MIINDNRVEIQPGSVLRGATTVPGDKSISHRAALMGAIAAGKTQIQGWLAAGDTEASLRAIQSLGVRVDRHDRTTLTIHGGNMSEPIAPIHMVNAGTGIRLLAGILAGQPFASVLDGSEQLRRRPMNRIIEPLRMMGARIEGADGRAPLRIQPARLRGIHYEMPLASAQVKSAILLAGLFADSATTIFQPGPARDHTERMLKSMGAAIEEDGNIIRLTPNGDLRPMKLIVPGDFSSAAFLMAAAAITPDSDLTIRGVNLNPTRTGLLEVMLGMGADIVVTETGLEAGEPVGDIRVRYRELKGVSVSGDMVVRMIDEFPVLMVIALCANGITLARDAQELRVKETDRIAVMASELRKLGAEIVEFEDGFQITGRQKITGGVVDGHDDHRIAMSLTIAGLFAGRQTIVADARCASDSFPGFYKKLADLGGRISEQA